MRSSPQAKEGRIGSPVLRKEDERFLRGEGKFVADLNIPGQAYACMIRSPHAHAKIISIDASDALGDPQVLCVLTGRDALEAGLKPIPHLFRTPANPPDISLDYTQGREPYISPHHALPADRARFVGEAIAVVVAETQEAALGAAEKIIVDYEPLDSVVNAECALQPGAPLVWDDLESNLCLDGQIGDQVVTEQAFQRAAHVVRIKSVVQRVTGVPMEPRSAVALYEPETERYTLHAGSSGPVRLKIEMATVLGVAPETIRVVSGDVGGNFGTRNSLYPEYPVLLWAAKHCGRPVKWVCERSEAFLCDYQGRDLSAEAELALDAEGRFLALRGDLLSNIGAHTVSYVAIVKGAGMLSSVYRIPTAFVRAKGILTHTPPTHPLRSTGRPEAMLMIERLIEAAAERLGIEPIELRQRNLISESEMPYTNPFGLVYDSGDYGACMRRALDLSDWSGFAERKAASLSRGRFRGIGISNYIEVCTGAPRERAEITILPDGWIDLVVGTQSSGQGHETAFSQLLVSWLNVPFESIQVRMGDTDVVSYGGGSHSGRSMRMISIVVEAACRDLIDRSKRLAAHLLQASEGEIRFENGSFTVQDESQSVSLLELGAVASSTDVPAELSGALKGVGDITMPLAGFPYGTHVCEVEIDSDTGELKIENYVAVDDVGRAVNPLILHGQAHGGIAHGVGQAIMEHCVYDKDHGALISGSFMDYAMPRASDFCDLITDLSEVPSPTNALGIRAGGEGGTTPALAVVSNAVTNALGDYGVAFMDLPITGAKIWAALQSAKSKLPMQQGD
jgi:carbon-monoxide dehydrogenase large subunit